MAEGERFTAEMNEAVEQIETIVRDLSGPVTAANVLAAVHGMLLWHMDVKSEEEARGALSEFADAVVQSWLDVEGKQGGRKN